MALAAALTFLLGLACTILASPIQEWSEDDVAVMALYSADYYNKVSGEDVIYRLVGEEAEYIAGENVSFHQISFPIQETKCLKSDNKPTDDCAFKEGGVVKSCTSRFFEEDDRDVVVVTCQNQDGHQEHSRVRRSRGGRGGRGGGGSRGGRGSSGRGRTGSGSFIAGGGNRGSRGGRQYA
uniref:Cathelicidin n=1 Tax=Zhangixalus puerensis TaxID=493782 RepID=A0A2Z2ZAT1_9NEOB|nr:cathelicidin precursor [Zhangixalus puerensis]